MKVGIVGYGRFGKLLARLLNPDFELKIVDANPENSTELEDSSELAKPNDLSDCKYIFLAVPIAGFEDALVEVLPHISESGTLIDVCSVKDFPYKLMQKHVKNCRFLATHPLFGPDSVNGGLKGLKMAICGGNDKQAEKFWSDYWQGKGLEIINTTPKNHDHDIIYSLGLTQTIARLIGRMQTPELTLTTKNFDAVNAVLKLSLSDTDQLYHDMLHFNPYFGEMYEKFTDASVETASHLKQILSEGPYSKL